MTKRLLFSTGNNKAAQMIIQIFSCLRKKSQPLNFDDKSESSLRNVNPVKRKILPRRVSQIMPCFTDSFANREYSGIRISMNWLSVKNASQRNLSYPVFMNISRL